MWNYELAQKLKKEMKNSKESAIDQACSCIGKIESTNPLVISAFGGEAMFDDEQLILTRTFKTYLDSQGTKLKGKDVILAPAGSPTTVAVIDVVGG